MLVCSFPMKSRKGLAHGAVGACHTCWLLHNVENAVGHNGSQCLGLCLLHCQMLKCNKFTHESVKKKPKKHTNKPTNRKPSYCWPPAQLLRWCRQFTINVQHEERKCTHYGTLALGLPFLLLCCAPAVMSKACDAECLRSPLIVPREGGAVPSTP